MSAIQLYYWACRLYKLRIPLLPKLFYYLGYLLFNCSVPYQAKIGSNTKLGYGGMGVVIHHKAVIGRNCVIAQQVTIGGRGGYPGAGVPVIGDNVYIGAGAKVLGGITIGDYCVIGANAVVIHDLPSYAIAVGVPAKVIKYQDREKEQASMSKI